MHSTTRKILFSLLPAALLLGPQATVYAQEAGPDEATEAPASDEVSMEAPASDDGATSGATEWSEALEPQDRYEVRRQLSTLLRHYSSDLGMVLALDPSLLSDRSYLSEVPEVLRFLDEHPEVRSNPRFYLGEFTLDRSSHLADDLFEGLAIFSVFLLIALSLAWLVRTVIEQKRWSRLSRTQTEVHTRLLERFGSSEELLEYMRTPAGAKFLESAPIPVRAGAETPSAPMSRILWSIQIGVVVAAAAVGLLFLSWRLGGESGEGLFALGVVALCVGGGFVASALVSWKLSRRLGLWSDPEEAEPPFPGTSSIADS